MNSTVIEQCVTASVSGTMTFPEIVGKLLEIGVERYTVDLVAMDHRSFGRDGEIETRPVVVPQSSVEGVAATFDRAGVQAAILGAQQGRVRYPEFVARAKRAGVAAYTAYLEGRRVVYTGRHGESHLEPFPGTPQPE